MWVDACCRNGRQKEKKLIILLLVLAAGLLGLGVILENKSEIMVLLPSVGGDVFWSDCTVGAETEIIWDDGTIYLAENGTLTEVSPVTGGMEPLALGETVTLRSGFVTAAYEPLSRQVYLPETKRHISFPGSVAALSVGTEKYLSAIIACSGYRTKTVIFDDTGETVGEIALKDKTMVATAFMEEDTVLAALCLRDGGTWELSRYTSSGELQTTIPLNASLCYGLQTAGDYAAVETEAGILIYTPDGRLTEIPAKNIHAWTLTKHGNVLLIDNNFLKTYLPDGTAFAETQLDYVPRTMLLSGNTIYILFGEGVGIYDTRCRELGFHEDGAKAAGMILADRSCLLFPHSGT